MADVIDNPAQHRFELTEDGETAELVYEQRDRHLVLVHTGVPDDLGGRGIGGQLVRAAVERAGRDGLTIVPRCPYARNWLEKHPAEVGPVGVDWAA